MAAVFDFTPSVEEKRLIETEILGWKHVGQKTSWTRRRGNVEFRDKDTEGQRHELLFDMSTKGLPGFDAILGDTWKGRAARSPCFSIIISGRTDGSCHCRPVEGQRRVLPSRGQSTCLLPSCRQSTHMEGGDVSFPNYVPSAQKRAGTFPT